MKGGEETQNVTVMKRSRPSSSPSHPFIRLCNATKPHQIHQESNLSDYGKIDSFFGTENGSLVKTQFESAKKRPRGTGIRDMKQSSVGTDDWSHISIKDLRIRRVFSPAPVEKEAVGGDKMRANGGFNAKSEDGVEGNGRGRKGDGEVLNGCDELNDECVQGTPPDDVEIFDFRCENGDRKVELVSRNTEQASLNQSSGKEQQKEIGNNSAAKSVVRPLSRRMVFKTPGSFSYRRLLPYLMDIVKDQTCSPKKGNCPTIDGKRISINESKIDKSIEGYAGDSGTMPQDVQNFVNGFSASDLNVTSVEQGTDSSMPIGSQTDPCISVTCLKSPGHDCYPKPIVNERNREIEGVSLKEENLNNGDSTCPMPVDGEEINRTDGGFSCDAHAVNDTRHNNTLIEEKHQLNESGELSYNTIQSETVSEEAIAMVRLCKTEDPSQICPNSSETERNSRACVAEKADDKNGDVLHRTDDFNEESIQLRPPDADKIVDEKVECSLKKADQILGKPSNGIIHRNTNCAGDKRIDSTSEKKQGLNPCSRPKIFKTPSSFSYRRLLPYLMDISNDNFGAMGNLSSPKLEKCSEEKPVSPDTPLSTSDFDGSPTEKSNNKHYHEEHGAEHSNANQMDVLTATNHASSDAQPELTSAELNSGSPASRGSREKQDVEVAEIISDMNMQVEVACGIASPIHGSNSTTMPLRDVSQSFSEHGLSSVPHALTIVDEGYCIKSEVTLAKSANTVEAGSLSQNSSQLKDSNPLGIPAYGLKRSILKRNPRGCRGRCDCLNCASFHLHAERAFEFSKNQMQDAEEVAFNLIKELSRLRTVLEKSAHGSDDDRFACNTEVKEICRQASEAEEMAKYRLSQMNNDLNIHCRITCGERPRVKFANNVEERVIP